VKILLECEVDEKTPYTLTEKLHGRNRQAEGDSRVSEKQKAEGTRVRDADEASVERKSSESDV